MRKKRRKSKRPKKQKPRLTREDLARALSHPLRAKALSILSERLASPSEIADELDASLSNVAYHVRVLDELGLIEVVEEEIVRGSIGHFYKTVDRAAIDLSYCEDVDPRVRRTLSGQMCESLLSDAMKSLSAGLFDERKERHLSRTPLRLDEEGWRKVLNIQAKAIEDILEAQEAATGRLRKAEGSGFSVLVAMACFEVPSQDNQGDS